MKSEDAGADLDSAEEMASLLNRNRSSNEILMMGSQLDKEILLDQPNAD